MSVYIHLLNNFVKCKNLNTLLNSQSRSDKSNDSKILAYIIIDTSKEFIYFYYILFIFLHVEQIAADYIAYILIKY